MVGITPKTNLYNPQISLGPQQSTSITARTRKAHVPYRCRANMPHISQSTLDLGLGFQVKVVHPFELFSLRSEAVDKSGQRLDPTPCTLHHTPYTLHPAPYTLHPKPFEFDRSGLTVEALHPLFNRSNPETRSTGVCASVSVLQQRVVRERTPGPSCPLTPAGGLCTWSCWSRNQYTIPGSDWYWCLSRGAILPLYGTPIRDGLAINELSQLAKALEEAAKRAAENLAASSLLRHPEFLLRNPEPPNPTQYNRNPELQTP